MTTTESTRTQIDDGSPDIVQEIIDAVTAVTRKYFPEPRSVEDMKRHRNGEAPEGATGLQYIACQFRALADKTGAAAIDGDQVARSSVRVAVHTLSPLRLERELNTELSVLDLLCDVAKLAIALPDSSEPQKITAQITNAIWQLFEPHSLSLTSGWKADLYLLQQQIDAMSVPDCDATA